MDPNLLIVASVALAGGLLIGFLIGNLKSKSAGTRAHDAEAELEAYRKQVNEHFGETAEHFQALGQQYKSLYEHLASGADSLCDTPDAGQELSFVPRGMLTQLTGDDLTGEAEEPEETAPEQAPEAPAAAAAADNDTPSEAPADEVADKLSTEDPAKTQDFAGDDEPPADQLAEQSANESTDQAVDEPLDDAAKPAGGDKVDAPKVAADSDANGESRPLYH